MEIQFKDITANVTRLHQRYTYEGLLEGVPTDKMNARILKNIPREAEELTYNKNYYLIAPEQTPIEIGRPYPFGEPMSLPGIVCIVGLTCYQTSNPDVSGMSKLTLIIFQNAFAPPFDTEVLDRIKHIRWFAYAKDIRWDEF